jgi:hypothetical protein
MMAVAGRFVVRLKKSFRISVIDALMLPHHASRNNVSRTLRSFFMN